LELFTGFKGLASAYTFQNCTNLNSVVLPKGITTIDSQFFDGCTNLASVNLPESITNIGAYILRNTPAEIEVYLPNLISLSRVAFVGSVVRKVLSLGKITSLGDRTFSGCTKLTDVYLPDTLEAINDAAFENAKGINIKHLPQSIKAIATGVFDNIKIEVPINLPNLVSIGINTFRKTNIISIVSLGKITSIPEACFDQCSYLESVILSKDITSIGKYAFRLCSTLVIDELNLPKLTSIGLYAFQDVKISRITNLGTITAILEYCFSGNPNLTSVVLPETITELGKGCFGNCTNLTDINLPKSIKVMGSAFQGTKVSMVVDLPNLESISANAFLNTNIERIESLGKITTLTYAFDGCKSLYYVKLPSSITEITYAAFRNCYALQTIICEAITPPTISDIFINTNDSFIIYVPGASVSAYKSATNWSKYASRIKPLSELPVNE
jgi:hypothetical protein